MSCLSTINASNDENIDLMLNSNSFSKNIDESTDLFDSSNYLHVSENDGEDDGEDDDEEDDGDGEEIDDDEDDGDIDEYLESFNATDEYLNFIKYLIKEKGFRFNNHLDDEDDDNGYSLYSSQTVSEKLYDERIINIYRGYEYYIPLNQRCGHVLNTYYPDIIYERFNQYSVDELYLGWLKWEENYQLLGFSNISNIFSNKKIGSKVYKNKKSNIKGEYTIKKSLTKKSAKITVKFNGDNNYNSVKKSAYIYQNIKFKDSSSKVNYMNALPLNRN